MPVTQPGCDSRFNLTYLLGPYFSVAIAAVNWPVLAGLKRYFGALATIGAGSWEHLARGSVTVVATATAVAIAIAL